ncbi:MAG: abortive phage infection protein, partial [Clostridia bacterium]|nr:abortive phage infection protein [Clostridia bacterium]NCD04469.1 abortive phage infection protein [Clostridia bacterium]
MKVKDVKGPYKKLDELVEKNNGILKTGDALAEGVSKPVLSKYLKLREFERMEHGIYLSPDAWMDEMYILHLRSAQAVFSHDSALYLHDMTLRVPLKHTVTLMTGYNPSRLTADGIKVYTVKKEL